MLFAFRLDELLIEGVHRAGDVVVEDVLDGVGCLLKTLVDLVHLLAHELAENPIRLIHHTRDFTDPDADSGVACTTQNTVDIAQSVVSAGTAALADPDGSDWECDVVDDDQQIVLRIELEEAECLPDALSGPVHEGCGLHEQALLTSDVRVEGDAVEARLGDLSDGELGCQCIDNHKPGVVPSVVVLHSWISKSDDQFHS